MARPIKRLETEPAVTEELRRRLRSRTCLVRERERAEIILLRLEGIGVAENRRAIEDDCEARLDLVETFRDARTCRP